MPQKHKKKSVFRSISKVILDYLREDALTAKPLDDSVARFINAKKHGTRQSKTVKKAK